MIKYSLLDVRAEILTDRFYWKNSYYWDIMVQYTEFGKLRQIDPAKELLLEINNHYDETWSLTKKPEAKA